MAALGSPTGDEGLGPGGPAVVVAGSGARSLSNGSGMIPVLEANARPPTVSVPSAAATILKVSSRRHLDGRTWACAAARNAITTLSSLDISCGRPGAAALAN